MKQLKNISKEKAQRILFITVLVLVFGIFFISLKLIDSTDDVPDPPPIENPDGNDPDVENPDPVIETILAPYTANVETLRKFWALDKETEEQMLSIIVTGSSNFMSTGVSYAKSDDTGFDVIASLSGKVKDVTESALYGSIITIEHDNNLLTEYMSLSDVNVQIGDKVVQGDVIGKSGQNEYDRDANNHLHFRITFKDKYMDPETLIGMKLTEVK